MLQQQQRSHIPKFGSWDADNVPYTAYFENARKDKGTGVMINPNDPEQNPEAFMKYGGNDDINFDERNMNSDQSSNSSNQQSYKSDRRKSINSRDKRSNFSPPSPSPRPNRPRYGYNPADDIVSHRSASVPMFGAWDEKDPKSAEGFTVIFQKVKEEKHIAATNFPPIPRQSSCNLNNPKKETRKAKKWCCF
ncbi:putative RPM1-interacting protein 4/NOI4 [Helianthus debilis subsp. tardiflorus]